MLKGTLRFIMYLRSFYSGTAFTTKVTDLFGACVRFIVNNVVAY